MLKRTAKIFLFTLSWYHLIAFQGFTQAIIPNVEIFGSNNGLSQVSVNCMLQDSHGFLWIGTQDGLNLFDGRVFTRFQQDPADSTSIVHSDVKAIVEDPDGNIWVGTMNGLCMFDRRKGKFTNPLKYIADASFKSDQNIYGLCLDHSDTLWIKTLDALFKYNIKTKEFFVSFRDRILIDNNPDQVTLPLIMDNRSNLLIGTKEGLWVKSLNEPAKHFLHSPVNMKSISDNTITALLQDKEGKIWVGTQHGLNEFDSRAETFKNFTLSKQDTGSANNIISLVEGEKGTIWIGTPKSIYKYSKITSALERLQDFYWNNNRMPLQVLSAMLMDKSSILWVGISQGLLKFDTKPKKFNLYRKNDLGFPAFSSNDIGAIMENDDGKLWFGTWGTGLNIYDRTTQKVEIYTAESKDYHHRISNDNVRVIFKDRNQTIYIGTQDGIDIYDRQTKTFSPFCNKINAASCSFMKNNREFCIIEDKYGNFWVGTTAGMFKYDSKYKLFRNYNTIMSNSEHHEIKMVYSLCEDKHGFIWIGTDNGLIRFDPVKLIYKIYSRPEHPVSTSLSSNSIYSLHEDSAGTLWVGTASGLDRYIPEIDGFKVFTVNNGLPNNLIYTIVDDSHSNLWMTTNRGIVRMNTEKEKFTSFDISDGMQDYEYNIQASFKSKSGEIFFGGIAGINSFYPDSIKSNKNNPDVTITSFELNTTSGVIPKPVFGLEKILVPYKSRTFTIEFAMLEFTDPINNHYKYKLTAKGDEGTWIDAGTRNYASFNNVPPGEYEFTVWGSNSDIIWAQHETKLEIHVENHWLLTKTAYIIYSLLLLLFIYLYIQIRTHKLRNDNKILREKEQTSIKIEKQKEELTIKNKNITDSLNYAKRIQQALMPSEKNFKKILPNSFVLHRPKDIVSGDFYWINETKDLIYVSAIDCTGHGVPGAFMSIIGFELFRKIATSPEKYDPDKVLNLLNDDFANIFKDVEGISLKDGMDIALCIIDKHSWSLQFSGAFNPIYIIRDEKIIELKGDRFSVGLDDEEEKHQGFTSQQIQLIKNDMIYLFSDGFADQFGGPEGKKFKYRRFRHILLNIHTLPLSDQRSLLDQTLDNWRGSIEQVDDVLVIGFKPEIE